ncbi:MAG: ADP-glyceromanno-heptose 6-epimerase [Bacteroidales bacterium]|nr:ADP-glyceromanno-heptose 6-epimerase [Bacteroidales bacterium]
MKKVIVTGAAGFIGSCLVEALNRKSIGDVVIVDDFSREDKRRNWTERRFCDKVERDLFFQWFDVHYLDVGFVFHIGARTDTTEFDTSVFDRLNVTFTQKMWEACSKYEIPLVYASSAATYGLGEHGYDDRHDIVTKLQPLNPYGVSKNEFDKWALQQTATPSSWYGFKFFNVYGPNEYHKGRMASVILHAFRQISQTGKMVLFQSHCPDFEDGMQLRDFVYVKDVVDVLIWTMEQHPENGIYNLGTGKARPFLALAQAVFHAMNLPENISFIPTPEDIRDKYQYFTEANMAKLCKAGYDKTFTSLETGVEEYVRGYLA